MKVVNNMTKMPAPAAIILTNQLRFGVILLGFDRGEGETTKLLGGAHGLERAYNYLSRPGAIPVANGLRFEQLRMREDGPELVVQAMEERPQVGRFVHQSLCLELPPDAQSARRHQAGFRPSPCHID